jgi:dTDP-4-dehydrorhamnose reductase
MERFEDSPSAAGAGAALARAGERDRSIEIWGGVECSVIRLGDEWRDQTRETGHHDRPDDIDQIAALGLRTIRYPVLWERVAPDNLDACDWSWTDDRLGRMRELGMRPILGLVHHGSGPSYINLLDDAFPDLLARYARAVAQRYPWAECYTPVNEPLTTARFCGLYGHWYPHRRDNRSFFKALVNQCLGVSRSMRAIREVNPAARLLQTEDLNKTFSTQRLSYQADFDNARRWLSLDLLRGDVDHHHWAYRDMTDAGIAPQILEELRDRPCQPDILGFNYYLTSERYLDENLQKYSRSSWGGNGRDDYADVEAARVELPPGTVGAASRLREAWGRYRLPMVLSEVHNGSTRREQLRWLIELWNTAGHLRREGVDLRAVTSWALFGSVDWDSLVTRRRGHYEAGAFDARRAPVRKTMVGEALCAIAAEGHYWHPALEKPGWWKRPDRYFGGPPR